VNQAKWHSLTLTSLCSKGVFLHLFFVIFFKELSLPLNCQLFVLILIFSQIHRYRGIDPLKSIESPTPTEFAQYIVDTSQKIGSENMDNHIRPLWSSCPFCAIDFDIIGQLEDYEEDEKFIVEKLDLDLPLGVHKNDAPGKKSKGEKRKEFFSELSTELTQKIFNVYKLDFEMFGYVEPIIQSS
jgi:hypothetical protein